MERTYLRDCFPKVLIEARFLLKVICSSILLSVLNTSIVFGCPILKMHLFDGPSEAVWHVSFIGFFGAVYSLIIFSVAFTTFFYLVRYLKYCFHFSFKNEGFCLINTLFLIVILFNGKKFPSMNAWPILILNITIISFVGQFIYQKIIGPFQDHS